MGAVRAGGTETSAGEALGEKDEGEALRGKLRSSVCFPGPRHSGLVRGLSTPSRGKTRLRARVLAGELPSSLLVRATVSVFW